MSELKCGDRVEVKEGDFKGSVGVIRQIKEVTKIHIQIDFVGKRKTLPMEILEKVGSNNRELTELSRSSNEEKENE
jgi:transcription antitermination factor NusG